MRAGGAARRMGGSRRPSLSAVPSFQAPHAELPNDPTLSTGAGLEFLNASVRCRARLDARPSAPLASRDASLRVIVAVSVTNVCFVSIDRVSFLPTNPRHVLSAEFFGRTSQAVPLYSHPRVAATASRDATVRLPAAWTINSNWASHAALNTDAVRRLAELLRNP